MGRMWFPDAIARDLILGPPRRILSTEHFDEDQWRMSHLVQTKKAVILGADPGKGKTGACLHGAIEMLKKGKVKKWLIVSPLRVAQETWPDSFHEWTFGREEYFSCVLGTEEERLEALKDDAPFHIINREMIPWLWKTLKNDWPYDGLIYDELSRLKSGERLSARVTREDGTKRGGNLNEFGSLAQARERGCFKRVVGLTGSPSPNGLVDLWGIMYLIDLGHRLGAEKKHFLGRWFERNQYSYTEKPFPHSEKEILGLIADALFIFQDDEALGLPPKRNIPVWVTLKDKDLARYKYLQREYVLEDHDVEAVNNGVLAGKLLQMANGFVYDSEQEPIYFHEEKLDALEETLQKAKGKPVIVVYPYIPDKERILKRFPTARVFGETDDDMRDWNAGKIPILLLHPASAGHGLNFQFASNILIWYGLTWSLEYYEQVIKRLWRRGQPENAVYVYAILAKGTYDVRQQKSLTDKDVTQKRIKNSLEELQKIIWKREDVRIAA